MMSHQKQRTINMVSLSPRCSTYNLIFDGSSLEKVTTKSRLMATGMITGITGTTESEDERVYIFKQITFRCVKLSLLAGFILKHPD